MQGLHLVKGRSSVKINVKPRVIVDDLETVRELVTLGTVSAGCRLSRADRRGKLLPRYPNGTRTPLETCIFFMPTPSILHQCQGLRGAGNRDVAVHFASRDGEISRARGAHSNQMRQQSVPIDAEPGTAVRDVWPLSSSIVGRPLATVFKPVDSQCSIGGLYEPDLGDAGALVDWEFDDLVMAGVLGERILRASQGRPACRADRACYSHTR